MEAIHRRIKFQKRFCIDYDIEISTFKSLPVMLFAFEILAVSVVVSEKFACDVVHSILYNIIAFNIIALKLWC